VIRCRS